MKVKLLVGVLKDGNYFGTGWGDNGEHCVDDSRPDLETQCWECLEPKEGNIEFFVVEAELPEIQTRTVEGMVNQ